MWLTMLLCCVVHTKDIKHHCEKKLVKVKLERLVTVKNACHGLFIDKTFLSGNPLNTDTPIIRTFWRVPLVSVLTGFHCIFICERLLLSCSAGWSFVLFQKPSVGHFYAYPPTGAFDKCPGGIKSRLELIEP